MNEPQLPETMLTVLSAWTGSRLYSDASWKTKCKVPLGQPTAASTSAILTEGAGIRAEPFNSNIHILVKPTDTSMAWNSLQWSYQYDINFTFLIVTNPEQGWEDKSTHHHSCHKKLLYKLTYMPGITNPLEVPGFTCSNWLADKHILIFTWRPPSFHTWLPHQHSWNPRIHPTDLLSCNTTIVTWPQILETILHLGLTVISVCSFLLKKWINATCKHCYYWELEQSRTGAM